MSEFATFACPPPTGPLSRPDCPVQRGDAVRRANGRKGIGVVEAVWWTPPAPGSSYERRKPRPGYWAARVRWPAPRLRAGSYVTDQRADSLVHA